MSMKAQSQLLPSFPKELCRAPNWFKPLSLPKLAPNKSAYRPRRCRFPSGSGTSKTLNLSSDYPSVPIDRFSEDGRCQSIIHARDVPAGHSNGPANDDGSLPLGFWPALLDLRLNHLRYQTS